MYIIIVPSSEHDKILVPSCEKLHECIIFLCSVNIFSVSLEIFLILIELEESNIIKVPSGEKLQEYAKFSSIIFLINSLVSQFHILIELSNEQEAKNFPQYEKLHDLILSVCSFKIKVFLPDKISHILIVLSFEQEIINLSSGEKQQ